MCVRNTESTKYWTNILRETKNKRIEKNSTPIDSYIKEFRRFIKIYRKN